MVKVSRQKAEHAVLGGAFLGGGGGGSLKEGKAFAEDALAHGFSRLLEITDLPPHATAVTVSLVGAPAAPHQCVKPEHFLRAVDLLRSKCQIQVDALMTSENGGFATVNGWYQSAVLGIPVIDAPCNGRAHPLGLMGSLGLHRQADYRACATAVGGGPQSRPLVEAVFCGSVGDVAAQVRQAAVKAGGMVAVARHPVPTSYVREHAAVGAISQAIRAGGILAARAESERKLQDLAAHMKAELVTTGKVTEVERCTRGGFDVGRVLVNASCGTLELVFWNEYMTLERNGERLATFPDLIATVDLCEAMPLTTALIARRQEVAIVAVPWRELILGAGMMDASLYREVEKAIGKRILPLPQALRVERH